jgi:hypothetical protein
MNYLNHKFQIVKEADIIIIKNCISNSALVAFKDSGIDLDKFKQSMYYGQSDDTDGSLESLEKDKLINSFPFAFTYCSEERMKSLFNFIRQYTEFFLSAIISSDLFEEYINRVEEIIKDKKVFDVYLSLGNSFPNLSKLLSEMPFLNIISENDDIKKDRYDIVITKGKDYEKNKLGLQKSERILFLNMTQSNIEIGPLVFASKFKIPNIDFESINTPSTDILKQEESLICFFLERILYINFFELYDKTSGIEFFPTRSRICIDRMNLHGYGELVPMYPIPIEV